MVRVGRLAVTLLIAALAGGIWLLKLERQEKKIERKVTEQVIGRNPLLRRKDVLGELRRIASKVRARSGKYAKRISEAK